MLTSTHAGAVLVLTTSPLTDQAVTWISDQVADAPVVVFCVTGGEGSTTPADWQRLRRADLMEPEALRRDFLRFLDDWPRQPVAEGRTFDQSFRVAGDYSLWWTGPGSRKHPDHSVFPKMRAVWLAGRALARSAPRHVLVHTKDAGMSACLASLCRSAAMPMSFVPGSSRPMGGPTMGAAGWWLRTVAWLIQFPVLATARAIMCRLTSRRPRTSKADQDKPAVVINAKFPRDICDGKAVNFLALENALRASDDSTPVRYLVQMAGGAGSWRAVYDPRWRQGAKVPGAAALGTRFTCLWAFYVGAARQLRLMWRYRRFEKTPEFAASMSFAGADVSSLYVPLLRRALSRVAVWEQSVACVRKALQAVGPIKALCVTEELYESGRINVAAARSLGIPTVGMQHGTIFPTHLIYAMTDGQVAGSPLVDHFAVYGQYAADVMSARGAFPADRLWITGGPRFDYLVNESVDVDAVRRSLNLNLPVDRRIVLIATQEYGWFLDAVRAVFEVARHRPDIQVVVKARTVRDHPLTAYQQLAGEAGLADVVFFLDQFNELLAACDVLVSGSSTTVFEAALLGKRTICVNFSDEPDRYPYVANGAALPARNGEQMAQSMGLALRDEATDQLDADCRRFLAYHAGPTAQGDAAETMAAHILSLGVGEPARAD
ncbi:MAG: hypothetical protein ACYS8X_02515 [Planctomycetota bacterium]|jgi:hypothetical protein